MSRTTRCTSPKRCPATQVSALPPKMASQAAEMAALLHKLVSQIAEKEALMRGTTVRDSDAVRMKDMYGV
eukprot:401549-Rhodomonas_salina.3